jgi:hypothetical protein
MTLLRNLTSRAMTSRADVTPVQPTPGLAENFLKERIDARDRAPDRSRVGGTDGYAHVSSLVAACARREILAPLLTEEARAQTLTGGHRLMWAYGRTAEKHIRDQFISTHHDVYGQWECSCGAAQHVGIRADGLCTTCGTGLYNYREQPVRDERRRIVGNPDMPFMLGGKMVVTEIKSMNKEQWNNLTSPLGDHIAQAATYRSIFKTNGFAVHDEVIIFYAVKEFKYGSPYKEFHVDCTSTTVESIVAGINAAAEEIVAHREAGTRPPRTVCASSTSTLAKNCPAVGLCFSLS